jgi:hypothetical protein
MNAANSTISPFNTGNPINKAVCLVDRNSYQALADKLVSSVALRETKFLTCAVLRCEVPDFGTLG